MKVVVIGGYADSLVKFRGELLESIVQSGAEVIAMAGDGDDSSAVKSELAKRGVSFVSYPLKRTGLSPLADLRTLLFLRNYLKKEKPDLVFSYTIKPVIWGNIASRAAGVSKIFGMVTGLGNQLSSHSLKIRVVSKLVGILYRIAFSFSDALIFQNSDDIQLLKSRGILKNTQSHVVNGSGVDIVDYPQSELPNDPPIFLTIARFLVAKGIREYAEAARIIKVNRPDVIFRVVGFEEEGENAIPIAELQKLHDEGVIELVGKVDNVKKQLQQCHIFVLASFYGEGLPRTILEALAIGRPVLTTDNVGCREGVEHGVNGILVEPKDVKALADGMQWFLDNNPLWTQMATASRELAVERYDVNKVNKEMLRIMGIK